VIPEREFIFCRLKRAVSGTQSGDIFPGWRLRHECVGSQGGWRKRRRPGRKTDNCSDHSVAVLGAWEVGDVGLGIPDLDTEAPDGLTWAGPPAPTLAYRRGDGAMLWTRIP